MEWKNDEMSVLLREDNIVTIRINEAVKELTVAAAEECVVKIREVMKANDKPKALLFCMSSIYVSKEVMRCYTDTTFDEAGTAVLCESFAAWLMGNIALTIAQRFMVSNPEVEAPMKAFKKEEKAIAWAYDKIKEAS